MSGDGLTQARLKELLSYDPDTGEFVWKSNRGSRARAGEVAGAFTSEGYRRIKIDGREYRAHRLAWLYVYGSIPDSKQIDHIGHDRADNRIDNLRLVTNTDNQKNRSLNANSPIGVCGVRVRAGRFIPEIRVSGVKMHLGSYDNLFDAAAARIAAQNRYGFHPNHGGA